MSLPAGIVIDEKKIKKVISQAWTTLGFFCVPDAGSAHVSAEDVDGAIGHIQAPNLTDQRFHAVGVRNGIGIFLTPVLGYKNALQIAEAIAKAIAPLGFTGTITARDDRPGRRPNVGRRGYSAAISSVEVAIDHRDVGLDFRPLKKNTDRWAVNSPAFRQIVAGSRCSRRPSSVMSAPFSFARRVGPAGGAFTPHGEMSGERTTTATSESGTQRPLERSRVKPSSWC